MNQQTAAPTFLRPAFVAAAKQEFDALVKACPDLQYVDAVLADVLGVLRGKRLPIAEAGKIFDSGMQIPHSLYLMDAKGEMTNPFGKGFGDGDPDGTAWPIPGTLTPVWGEGAARVQILMTLRDENGHPNPAEPRAALERVLERFAEWKLTPVVALELEFYLIDPERTAEGAPQPPLCPRSGKRERAVSVYGIDDLDRYKGFLSALNEAAKTQNVPVNATSKEYAPGQFEANLRHQADARVAADHAVLLKQIVKAAARANGFEATFMAKPYGARAGSGLHIHMSLLDAQGRNVFDNGSPEGSDVLLHVIGGLQALMPDSMALFAPSVNSYRRFQPDMFAPVNRRWGVNNRSAGLRVPVGPGEARRVEHRVSGADANPYYALAAVLAGAHHGLANKVDPGAPAQGNVSREPDLALPFSIQDALAKLDQSKLLAGYIGADTLKLYGETKRIEAQRLARIISAAEHDWYL
ncbi:MAG: glutamine synthetase [Proteobacteria bacterium]|nr:glutamine synthetase [Pseudomonadota bacterium]